MIRYITLFNIRSLTPIFYASVNDESKPWSHVFSGSNCDKNSIRNKIDRFGTSRSSFRNGDVCTACKHIKTLLSNFQAQHLIHIYRFRCDDRYFHIREKQSTVKWFPSKKTIIGVCWLTPSSRRWWHSNFPVIQSRKRVVMDNAEFFPLAWKWYRSLGYERWILWHGSVLLYFIGNLTFRTALPEHDAAIVVRFSNVTACNVACLLRNDGSGPKSRILSRDIWWYNKVCALLGLVITLVL